MQPAPVLSKVQWRTQKGQGRATGWH